MKADQSLEIESTHATPPDEKLYQMLMSTVKDYAIILLNKNGRVMSLNDGAQLIKGYNANDRNELLGFAKVPTDIILVFDTKTDGTKYGST